MRFFTIVKDNNKRKIFFLNKHIFTYKKGFKLFSKYTTCNYKNKYFLNHLIKSHKKSHQRIFDYLKKYLYALDNDLSITVTPSENLKIWQLWLQGNNTAGQNNRMPLIVEKCLQSVKACNPDLEVVLLTEDNLRDYVDFPDYIWDKYQSGNITKTHFSDLIRFYLLYRYGGIWCDATVYMTDKLPDTVLNADLFVFKDLIASRIDNDLNLEQFLLLCNSLNVGPWTNSISFIRAKAGNKIIGDTTKLLFEYWKHESATIQYLFANYFITLILLSDKECRELFIKSQNNLTTVEYGLLQKCLFEHFDKAVFESVKKITSIHKLTYKDLDKNVFDDSFYSYITK